MQNSDYPQPERKLWAIPELFLISRGDVASGTHNNAHEHTLQPVHPLGGGTFYYTPKGTNAYNAQIFPLSFFVS